MANGPSNGDAVVDAGDLSNEARLTKVETEIAQLTTTVSRLAKMQEHTQDMLGRIEGMLGSVGKFDIRQVAAIVAGMLTVTLPMILAAATAVAAFVVLTVRPIDRRAELNEEKIERLELADQDSISDRSKAARHLESLDAEIHALDQRLQNEMGWRIEAELAKLEVKLLRDRLGEKQSTER